MGANHHGNAVFRSPCVQWIEIESKLRIGHVRAIWSADTQKRRDAVQDDQVVVLWLTFGKGLVIGYVLAFLLRS